MRKEIKPAKVCDKCGSRLKAAVEVAFCDYCKEKILGDRKFEVTVFWKNGGSVDTQRQEFCSMKHTRQWLIEFPYNREKVEFISLPYIENYKELDEKKEVKK